MALITLITAKLGDFDGATSIGQNKFIVRFPLTVCIDGIGADPKKAQIELVERLEKEIVPKLKEILIANLCDMLK